MSIGRRVAILCFLSMVLLIGCVPQQIQLKGTWDFVGYKDARTKSVFEIDSTICFDGDGNGFYYTNADSSAMKCFSYLISEDHKLAIIINQEVSMVDYSINAKEKRLELDGLVYQYVSSEIMSIGIIETEELGTAPTSTTELAQTQTSTQTQPSISTPSSTPSSTPTSTPTLTPTPEAAYLVQLRNASEGEYVFFGSYEQDNNTSEKESIEWLVLKKDGNKLLLISRYALDRQQYNTPRTGVVWEDCYLRSWLNNSFYNEAFSYEEKRIIQKTPVMAQENASFREVWQGYDTEDRVFLLSTKEARDYFKSDSERRCKATAYAKAKGAYTDQSGVGEGCCWWWLRTSGCASYEYTYDSDASDFATDVLSTGEVDYWGNQVNHGYGAVRPAIWIILDN